MQRSVAQLTVHPAVALAWQMPDDHPRFRSLVASIREVGILEPIRITEDGRVADGRHRLRVARALGFETVECLVVSEDQVSEIALATLMGRRHLVTRGQLAYAAYPLFAEGHRELQARNAALIRKGASGGSDSAPGSVEDYAEQIGVGRELFKQAARIHGLFAEDADLKSEWEPKIMAADEPIGLGAALAGIRGQAESTDRTPARNTALHNWEVAWGRIVRPAASWERWTPEEREYAAGALRAEFSKLPEPVLDVVRDALRATRRARAYSGAEGQLERMGFLTPKPDSGSAPEATDLDA